jgi:hypothetical protein
MNKVAMLAVAGAVVMVLAGTTAASAEDSSAPTPPKPQVSAAAGKDLQAAQKALTAKSYDEVLTDLDKVKANPKKNDYDEYLMNEFYFSAYAGAKKFQEAQAPLEAAMTSKYMPPDELKQRHMQAAALAYQLQNYDKAVEFGNLALKDGTNTVQLNTIIAQSYYLKNDFKTTASFVRGMVDDEVKAGEKPDEEILLLGESASQKLNDDAGESHWLELLAGYHPKPAYWQNLLQDMYTIKMTDKQLLQLYRLSADVGGLKSGAEYTDMAQLAMDAGSPGEAVSTLTAGFAANAFKDSEKARNQHLLDSAKKQAAADEPTLAKTEEEGASAATGDRLVAVGVGYYGYGEYAKAVKDLSAGLAKGMSKDSTDARLLLGVAQFKAGDKQAAVQTFGQVKGNPASERLAALWILHAKA